LAWTEDSESHAEGDNTHFWNFPCGRTKNILKIVFTGMQSGQETIGSLLFAENVGYFLELFSKMNRLNIYFATWIHRSHMSLNTYGLFSTWTSFRTSLCQKKKLKKNHSRHCTHCEPNVPHAGCHIYSNSVSNVL
jgi:hypothetical protein